MERGRRGWKERAEDEREERVEERKKRKREREGIKKIGKKEGG